MHDRRTTSSTWILAFCLPVASAACAQSVDQVPFEEAGGAGVGGATSLATGGSGGSDSSSIVSGSGAGPSSSSAAVSTGSGGSGPNCTIDNECIFLATPCVSAYCNPQGQCASSPIPEGGACQDAMKCTVGKTCNGGICGGGTAKDCSGLDSICGDGVCDQLTGACEVAPKNEGASCDDADPCTSVDVCAAGTCAGAPMDCSGLDSTCVLGACDPATLTCVAQPQTGPACDDGNLCTLGDACAQGACVAGPLKDCASRSSQCTVGVCETSSGNCVAQPTNEGVVCNDANVCTESDVCQAGACQGVAANEGAACSDGIACTSGEICTSGVCQAASPKIYLFEAFGGSAPGWTFGPEWEMGPAQSGSGDPSTDHTSSVDNGVAGVVIGGAASQTLHGYYYLESPPVNVGGPGSVILSYYRYLDCLWDAWTHHTVEVFDGAAWQTLWVVDFPGVHDSDWTLVTFDLTPYKNPALRVRFGFDMVSVASMGSWTIDDVAIGDTACP